MTKPTVEFLKGLEANREALFLLVSPSFQSPFRMDNNDGELGPRNILRTSAAILEDFRVTEEFNGLVQVAYAIPSVIQKLEDKGAKFFVVDSTSMVNITTALSASQALIGEIIDILSESGVEYIQGCSKEWQTVASEILELANRSDLWINTGYTSTSSAEHYLTTQRPMESFFNGFKPEIDFATFFVGRWIPMSMEGFGDLKIRLLQGKDGYIYEINPQPEPLGNNRPWTFLVGVDASVYKALYSDGNFKNTINFIGELLQLYLKTPADTMTVTGEGRRYRMTLETALYLDRTEIVVKDFGYSLIKGNNHE